ncbi:MAG: hypothetical protein JOZ69_18020, partial [Myxococcales bacterium]|nr:hypothetical protein [Myxococcales bacterium]
MKVSRIGLVVLAALCPLIVSLGACGSTNNNTFGAGGGSSGGGNGGSGSGASSGGPIVLGGGGSSSGGGDAGSTGPTMARQTVLAPDCQGCSFPAAAAPACSGSAPPITLVYPSDNILVPPNMGLISVQWKPNGNPYTTFEIDFSNPPNTDWRIITKCSQQYQTTDMQTNPAAATGGCDFPISGASWSYLAGANRGGNPVQVTVRGTTDGNCATTSNPINVSFAQEDLVGTYYYWKSTVSSTGVGGQIWSKLFGAPATPEANVTSSVATANRQTLNATCNGCHALSRDGSRMVVYSDDDDSDDEYSDIGGSLLDLTQMPAREIGVGVSGMRQGGQPVGFSTIDPLATLYLTSNGIPLTGTGTNGASTSAGYTVPIPANAVSLWNAQGALVGPVALANGTTRPTMPDWSIDGTRVVYVQPQAVAHWDANGGTGFTGSRDDDAHIFGGSLYTVPYMGNSSFGTPTLFLQSAGENNYYPSYSPDATSSSPPQFIIFNRAPLDMSMGSPTACTTGAAPTCPNDSFSNPAARLMLANANTPGGTPIDLEKANGSPAANPIPWSNSYPRWAPFVQTYKGSKILWFTFSSTRDYGLRILNHKTGMYQCYPADAYETPGGAHGGRFAAQCQEPQLWMAPLTFGENAGTR